MVHHRAKNHDDTQPLQQRWDLTKQWPCDDHGGHWGQQQNTCGQRWIQPDGAPLDEGPSDSLTKGCQQDQGDPVGTGDRIAQSAFWVHAWQLAIDEHAVGEVEPTTWGTGVSPDRWRDQLRDTRVQHWLYVEVFTRRRSTGLAREVQVERVANTGRQAEQRTQGRCVDSGDLCWATGISGAFEHATRQHHADDHDWHKNQEHWRNLVLIENRRQHWHDDDLQVQQNCCNTSANVED